MNDIDTKIILDKLYALQRFGIKPGLERTSALLEFCGNPHNNYPSIHVAGTNGKGSVCSIIASVLQEAGYKVGLYTSPHIVSFNGRIKISGVEISDADIVRLANSLMPESDRIGCTFFEITTAMAFQYFSENNVDVAVIETGLGGRFDSTNVLNPVISIITNIALEHQEYLGNKLQEIAFEKAGIIKQNTPVIIGNKNKSTLDVFQDKANEFDAKLFFAEDYVEAKNIEFENNFSMSMDVKYDKLILNNLSVGLAGLHQVSNVKTALTAFSVLKSHFNFNENHIRLGLQNIRANTGLSGRIELIRKEPLLIIDVAHNPDAIDRTIETISECGYGSVVWNVVFAAMEDKDIINMLKPIHSVCNKLILTEPNISRAATVKHLNETASKLNYKSIIQIKNVGEAVKFALNENQPALIIGSFYLAGEAMPVLKQLISQ